MTAASLRAAVYCRISREDEADILQNQLEALQAHCAAQGLEVTRVYQEVAPGVSERPVLSALLHDAALRRGRPFDLVVFQSLSRMTRGGVEAALHILRVLEMNEIGWHIVEQPMLNYDSTTPALAKDIILSVLAAVDKDYRRRISEATKAAYAKRKALADANRMRVRWGRRPKTTSSLGLAPAESGEQP